MPRVILLRLENPVLMLYVENLDPAHAQLAIKVGFPFKPPCEAAITLNPKP